MQVIPSIDIFSGKSERLTEGLFSERTDYTVSPVEMAKKLSDNHASSLHIVDLEGARRGSMINWEAIEQISKLGLDIQVGGGIRDEETLSRLFSLGVNRAVIGTLAIKKSETVIAWGEKFGFDRFCLAMDLRGTHLALEGWERAGEDYRDWLSTMSACGFQRFLSTDISKDGKLQGPNFDLYRLLKDENPNLEWIASGGVSSLEDLEKLHSLGLFGAVIGKALFEGCVSLVELSQRYWQSKEEIPC